MKRLKVDFTYGAVLIAALLIIGNYTELILPIAAAVTIHEIGHITAILFFGGEIGAITLNAGGLKIAYNSYEFTYAQDIICAIMGPLFGIIAAIIASHAGFKLFGGISLCMSVFNSLPIRPLDGGRILWNIFMTCNNSVAEKTVRIIEISLLAAIFSFSIYIAVISGGNFTLLFVTLVLTFYYCKER